MRQGDRMRVVREWLHRLAGTLLRRRCDTDLEEELRLHLEMAAEDARSRGLEPADAVRAAHVKTGAASQAMDALRDQRGLPWLDDLARDVSHGLRTLRRTPVFTAVALLTLALAIGANTAIFSIVNGVILRPLDYPKPAQLMFVTAEFRELGLTRNPLSVQEYLEFRQINQSFAAVGAYRTTGGAYTTGEVNLTAGGRPLRVRSISVDADLLGTLGVQPAQGRLFTAEETSRAGGLAPPLAIYFVRVVASGLWRTATRRTDRECRRSASRNPWDHAIRRRCHGQPHGNLVAARAPCGYSSEPRLPHPPCRGAIERRRHASGGADGTQRTRRELGRAYRLVGPCPHQSSNAGGRPHASDRAGTGRDSCRCPSFDLDIASRCWVRPADCVRESCEPAHGPRRVTSS